MSPQGKLQLKRQDSSAHLHQFLQLPFDILKTSNVIPGDIRHLYHRLPQSTWAALTHRILQNA